MSRVVRVGYRPERSADNLNAGLAQTRAERDIGGANADAAPLAAAHRAPVAPAIRAETGGHFVSMAETQYANSQLRSRQVQSTSRSVGVWMHFNKRLAKMVGKSARLSRTSASIFPLLAGIFGRQ